MGEGKHGVKACRAVAVQAGDVPVAVVGYVALRLSVNGDGCHPRIVQGVRQALETVIFIAVCVGSRRWGDVVRREGDLGDVAVVACRGAGLLRGGVAQRFSEHSVLPPVVARFDARGPAVEVVVEGNAPDVVRAVADLLAGKAAEIRIANRGD